MSLPKVTEGKSMLLTLEHRKPIYSTSVKVLKQINYDLGFRNFWQQGHKTHRITCTACKQCIYGHIFGNFVKIKHS